MGGVRGSGDGTSYNLYELKTV